MSNDQNLPERPYHIDRRGRGEKTVEAAENALWTAKNKLESFYKSVGLEVINPMKLPHMHTGTWAEYMAEDLLALEECHGILMLDGIEQSKGAQLEAIWARAKGIPVGNVAHAWRLLDAAYQNHKTQSSK